MKRELNAFVSFGLRCNGPEAGDYGRFTVNLTDEEWAKVDSIIANPSGKRYLRFDVESKYPDIDEKIREAGDMLVRKISVEFNLEIANSYNDDISNSIIEDIRAGLYEAEIPEDGKFDDDEIKKWEEWEVEWVLGKPKDEHFLALKERCGFDEYTTEEEVFGTLCYYLTESEMPKR